MPEGLCGVCYDLSQPPKELSWEETVIYKGQTSRRLLTQSKYCQDNKWMSIKPILRSNHIWNRIRKCYKLNNQDALVFPQPRLLFNTLSPFNWQIAQHGCAFSVFLGVDWGELAKAIALATCLLRGIRELGQSFVSFVDSTCGTSFCHRMGQSNRDANAMWGRWRYVINNREQKATELARVLSTECTLYCATLFSFQF